MIQTNQAAAGEKQPVPWRVKEIIRMMISIASLCGFDVVGEIKLRDRETGREWVDVE